MDISVPKAEMNADELRLAQMGLSIDFSFSNDQSY